MTEGPVGIRKKSESGLFRFLVKIPFVPKSLMTSRWTTLGRIVFVPSRYDTDPDWGEGTWFYRHKRVWQHESCHVRQFELNGIFVFLLLYFGPSPLLVLFAFLSLALSLATVQFWLLTLVLFFLSVALAPLSVGLAYGRWKLEREAFIAEYQGVNSDLRKVAESVARSLWENYCYTWPPQWAESWLLRKLKEGAPKG